MSGPVTPRVILLKPLPRRAARTWPAALALFVIAALIPESVVTFNSPPLLLLTQPVTLPFLCAFYGSVALLVREFIRRRAPRWSAVLLLGLAAGCVNEGIIAGTWYKVPYRGYALIGPVDPALAVGLAVFHALVSTIAPILLAEIMFPRVASRPWLGRRGLAACAVLLALTTASGFAAPADRGPKALVLAGVTGAITLALLLPPAASRDVPGPVPPPGAPRDVPGPVPPPGAPRDVPVPGPVPRLGTPRILRLAGALATITFFVIFAIVPGVLAAAVPRSRLPAWQPLLIIAMAGFFAAAVAAGRRWAARPGWGQPQVLAVIVGALLPPIVLSLVLPAAWHGLEPLVTVPALALLA